ncbi:MAG: 1-acyl-sn-glycerol-3-phosphate acyltransferase [Desulfuromonadaceae bacterium]|nr:1-acyl-sn-glycerol-3-phosphate acyltransferase [Desulfuromonadaceae bacterium]
MISPLLILLLMKSRAWSLERVVRHLIWVYGRGWLLLIQPWVRFERCGLSGEEIPRPCVYVINHLSFFDTYFMAALPDSDVAFAVRSWPFRMFWYRLFMRGAGYLEVENQSWAETIKQGCAVLRQGGCVLFFPEGHRSRNGELQRFYSGAFQLAIAARVPVVPLCITGTDRLLPPGRHYLKPARVRLRVLPAISSEPFQQEGGARLLRISVKGQMAEALREMKGDGAEQKQDSLSP